MGEWASWDKRVEGGAHVDECGKGVGGGLDFGKESINKFKLSVSQFSYHSTYLRGQVFSRATFQRAVFQGQFYRRQISGRKPSCHLIHLQMFPRRVMQLFVPEMNTGHRYQNTVLMLTWLLEIATYTNSSFNIFIYYIMGSKYRETIKALFCRGRVAAKSKNANKEHIMTTSVVMSTVSSMVPSTSSRWSLSSFWDMWESYCGWTSQ